MKQLLFFTLITVTITMSGQTIQKKKPKDFIPKGYVFFEKITGDLNKDGLDDCVLIIKGTDKSKIITDQYQGKLDRNRRGVIILFSRKDHYELALKNYNCLSSENEDGGIYFPPELSVEIIKGNLFFHYGHGRYGYWKYNFRYQNSDFELIGYDQSIGGVVIESEKSINFLTKKKEIRINTNENDEGGQEVLKVSLHKIVVPKLIKLSAIKDFDDLSMRKY